MTLAINLESKLMFKISQSLKSQKSSNVYGKFKFNNFIDLSYFCVYMLIEINFSDFFSFFRIMTINENQLQYFLINVCY